MDETRNSWNKNAKDKRETKPSHISIINKNWKQEVQKLNKKTIEAKIKLKNKLS
jgi:hypothetical protein